MRMRVLTGVSLMAAVMACGDSTGVVVDDLIGSWNATKYEFVNNANSSQKADLLAQGVSLALTVAAGGSYSAVITNPGQEPDTTSGTIAIDGNTLTIAESGQGSPTPVSFSLSGNTLTLTDPDESIDFDNDGTDESATLTIVFQRI